jgi:3-dehydroquinate synthase
MTTRIAVGGPAPYDVVIGHGIDDAVADVLGPTPTVAVVHARAVTGIAQRLAGRLGGDGRRVVLIPVPDGEGAKELAVAASLWDTFADVGITRTDAVVAVGGGATTDLAGFAAATWLRGVRFVTVPTTLLGMVDAAVGGKTAINTSAGKNLVGVVHTPAGVVCDLDTLATLPGDDYVAGLAEVVKAGFIADPAILERIEADPDGATRFDGPHTRELVERAIAVKAAVVSADLYEHGGREVLNYGHTLGHAIEKVEGYRWRHGAAVSVGLVFAAELSGLARGLDAATVTRHRKVLDAIGLPTSYSADAWPALSAAMRVDKKVRSGRARFVLLDAIAAPVVVDGIDEASLQTAFAEVAQ